MLITYQTVKTLEEKQELTEEEKQALQNYVNRKQAMPCTATWHTKQLGHAEEILYKTQREATIQ